MTEHRHVWMVEQQTRHTYCHLCGVHKGAGCRDTAAATDCRKVPEAKVSRALRFLE